MSSSLFPIGIVRPCRRGMVGEQKERRPRVSVVGSARRRAVASGLVCESSEFSEGVRVVPRTRAVVELDSLQYSEEIYLRRTRQLSYRRAPKLCERICVAPGSSAEARKRKALGCIEGLLAVMRDIGLSRSSTRCRRISR